MVGISHSYSKGFYWAISDLMELGSENFFLLCKHRKNEAKITCKEKKKHEEMTMNIVGMTRAVELGEPCSFAKSCLTPFDPMSCSTPGFPVLHHLPELLKLMCIESAMPSNHLILCCPLLLLPSVFPSIRVFFSESALHIRWPRYWSFSFSTSPSNEYSGLIFFRTD